MLKKLALLLFAIFLSSGSLGYGVELEKKDYLTLVVGNYVHGFKEFETSVVGFEDSVSISIYYDLSTQSEERANQLAKRFRTQVPSLLVRYQWAKGVEVIVNVYSEDRTGRGYKGASP